MGAPLFSFVHSPFFSENQINSASDARRLPARGKSENSGLAGRADGRARLSADNRLSSAASPTWGSCPLGTATSRLSLAKAGSSAVFRARDGVEGNARSWGPPGYDPEFRPRFLACRPARAHASAATRGRETASLDTQGGVDIRFWGPSARRQGGHVGAHCPP